MADMATTNFLAANRARRPPRTRVRPGTVVNNLSTQPNSPPRKSTNRITPCMPPPSPKACSRPMRDSPRLKTRTIMSSVTMPRRSPRALSSPLFSPGLPLRASHTRWKSMPSNIFLPWAVMVRMVLAKPVRLIFASSCQTRSFSSPAGDLAHSSHLLVVSLMLSSIHSPSGRNPRKKVRRNLHVSRRARPHISVYFIVSWKAWTVFAKPSGVVVASAHPAVHRRRVSPSQRVRPDLRAA